jgi:predicted MFS family arabinose efflux permease
VIQIGMALFVIASLSWSYFFVTGTLQMWQAMVILVIHGCAGVLWQTPNQMLLYDIVGPKDLESAVRLNAMARYLAVLVGPAVGGAILLGLGAASGIMLNTLLYLPLCCGSSTRPTGRAFAPGRRCRAAPCADLATSCRRCAISKIIPSSSR